jgi:Mrp family chromosome partitioning ATPase
MKSSVAPLASSSLQRRRGKAGRELQTLDGKRHNVLIQRRGETILEHFRRIYLSLQSDADEMLPVIGITSAVAREGRTTIATGVAAAMAADLDAPIVLVEADLESPGVHRILGIGEQPGVCEYLRGEVELATALRQVSDRFYVLPAGDALGEAARLIRQLTDGDLRARLQASGALLVLDLPPILASSSGVLATSMADTLAFTVRAGQTTMTQVKDGLSRVREDAVRGIVLNGAEPQLPRWLRERS